MNDQVTNYLNELDVALRDVPADVRGEILGGVREELTGLDDEAAASRIAALGDPAFIAASAREGLEVPQPAHPAAAGAFPVVAALLVAFGGIVVPIAGWIVGLGMVWSSRAWFTWEKIVATFAPVAWFVIGSLVGWLVFGSSSIEVFGFSTSHVVLLATVLVPVVAGLWLLYRVRRTPRP